MVHTTRSTLALRCVATFLAVTVATGCGSDDPGIDSSNSDDVSLADSANADSAGLVDTATEPDTAATLDSGSAGVDIGPFDTGDGAPDAASPDAAADVGSSDAGVDDVGQPECTKPTDCPDATEACKVNACAADQTCQLADAPDGNPCTDGDACTAGDACGGGKCLPGPAAKCDDNNVCTDDSCDKGVGCSTKVNAAFCDDGNPCTATDTCSGGKMPGRSVQRL